MAYKTLISSPETFPGGDFDTFLLACWFHVPAWTSDYPSGQVCQILYDNYTDLVIELGFFEGGRITFYLPNILTNSVDGSVVGGGTAELDDLPDHFYSIDGWNCLVVSARMSTQTIQYMVNGQLLDPGVTWYSDSSITINSANAWGIEAGRWPPGIAFSDYWFDVGNVFLDLNNSSNVGRIVTSDNSPVFWGNQGELLTGSRPLVYLHGDADAYMNNLGSMGAWSLVDGCTPIENYTDIPGPGA